MSILEKMTVLPIQTPLGSNDFLSFAMLTLSRDDFLDTYKHETGVDLYSLLPKNAIEKLIDDAVSNDVEAKIAKYLDWLAINHWGLEIN